MVQVRSGSLSITGDFRENNEDRCHADSKGRFYIVADGMGGQNAGERASAIAIEVIERRLEQTVSFNGDAPGAVISGIDNAVCEANAEIMALGEVDRTMHSMGTTIVFLIYVGEQFYIGGVGDSRVYQLCSGVLRQLTQDHSLTQALLEHGTITEEEAVNHKYRNVLYRYLGSKEGGTGTKPCEIQPQAGERYLLCSDGVTDGVPDDQLAGLLAETDDPQQAAEAVVKAAQDGGSRDNITALTVFVD